jgi:hypothetical protein
MTTTQVVACCYCGKQRKKFGLVIENYKTGFEVKHSFLLGERYPEKEIESDEVVGSLALSDGFNGCKYCDSKQIFQCSRCQSLNCQGAKKLLVVTCGKCGNSGILFGQITQFITKND